MLFYSYSFIFIFFPLVFLFSCCLLKINKYAYLTFLSISSLIFYVTWRFSDVYLFVFSIIVNYFIGKKLHESQNKTYLTLGVTLNLGLLFWFKYAYFFNTISVSLFGYDFSINKLVLPLAISFYTFEQIAYIVDSYKGIMVKHNFLEYLFLISFFPRLIAGPIIQPRNMLLQIKSKCVLTTENFSVGSTIFIIGLFKKLVIADYFSFFVDSSFSLNSTVNYHPGFIEAWSSSLAYAFQIYFDFSGYSDMAIGLALIFGIKLPINFNSPYKSLSITEFWRRWHISLSSFLRDYLYIPLGGNKKSTAYKYRNLMIVMLLGGMWHGANVTFLIWGLLHGSFLIINNIWVYILNRSKINISHLRTYKVLAWLITFSSVLIAWVYFRSDNYLIANKIVFSMLDVFHETVPRNTLFTKNFYIVSLITLIFTLLSPNILQWVQYAPNRDHPILIQKNIFNEIILWKPNIIYAFIITVLLFYSLLSQFPLDSQPPFIYFNF